MSYLKYFIDKTIALIFWHALAKAFNDNSHHDLREGNLTIEQYISGVEDVIDHLPTIGDTISGREKVLYVPGGLHSNYSSLITNVIDLIQVLYRQIMLRPIPLLNVTIMRVLLSSDKLVVGHLH